MHMNMQINLTLSGISVIQHFAHGDAIQIRDGIFILFTCVDKVSTPEDQF